MPSGERSSCAVDFHKSLGYYCERLWDDESGRALSSFQGCLACQVSSSSLSRGLSRAQSWARLGQHLRQSEGGLTSQKSDSCLWRAVLPSVLALETRESRSMSFCGLRCGNSSSGGSPGLSRCFATSFNLVCQSGARSSGSPPAASELKSAACVFRTRSSLCLPFYSSLVTWGPTTAAFVVPSLGLR